MSDLNIYQRINLIMQKSIYVRKGSAGSGTGVEYDNLISVLNPLLAEFGIVVIPEKIGESRKRQTAKGSYIYESDYMIHYVNIDNPEDKFSSRVEAHAMDSGDKAPGKAITYATKTSMLKVFGIESGDNEESRAELNDPDLINEDQVNYLFGLLCDQNGNYTPHGLKVCKAFKFNNIVDIRSKKYNEIVKAAGGRV